MTAKRTLFVRVLGRWLECFALLAAAAGPAAAQGANPALPAYASDVHLGARSCGDSTCHAAVAPWQNSTVAQNEFSIWSTRDTHSKAYAVLSSPRAQGIAAALSLGAAQNAPLCLGCHTDDVSSERRGRKFSIADGVGCEACHGGADNWIGMHVSGLYQLRDYLPNGMYPTGEPGARARLCLSCHVGDGARVVNHRMMAAGHPRMPFELDTFTAAEPAHYRISDEYKLRKPDAIGVREWALGQVEAARALLRRFRDPVRNHDGPLPELTLFDCFSCHRLIGSVSCRDAGATPRVNLANAEMLEIAAAIVDPPAAGALAKQIAGLNSAMTDAVDMPVAAAAALDATVQQLAPRLAAYRWDAPARRALLHSFARAGRDGIYCGFVDAEQATFGIAAVLAAMTADGTVAEDQYRPQLDRVYAAVGHAATYQSGPFIAAVNAVVGAVEEGE